MALVEEMVETVCRGRAVRRERAVHREQVVHSLDLHLMDSAVGMVARMVLVIRTFNLFIIRNMTTIKIKL